MELWDKETRYNPENVNIGHGKAYVAPSNVPVCLKDIYSLIIKLITVIIGY